MANKKVINTFQQSERRFRFSLTANSVGLHVFETLVNLPDKQIPLCSAFWFFGFCSPHPARSPCSSNSIKTFLKVYLNRALIENRVCLYCSLMSTAKVDRVKPETLSTWTHALTHISRPFSNTAFTLIAVFFPFPFHFQHSGNCVCQPNVKRQ